MPQVASSALAVPHSRIREIADLAMSMPGSLRLYFGESTLPTPAFIQQAAAEAMAAGYTVYTENAGLPSLRQQLAAHYARLHGVALDPASEIVVTASGVQALYMGIRGCLDPGDEALVLTPAWQNQMSIARMSGATVAEVPLALSEGRFHIDFDALERAMTPRTRLVVYTSPSNPLGWTATVDEQRRLLEFARRRDVWLLADEVYERLYYAGGATLAEPAPSILRLATREDPVIVVQSFSKSYCMTGWRVGWIVARRDFADRITKLNEFVVSCAAGFSQRAAEAALRNGEPAIAGMLEFYRANRDLCLEALRGLPGVTVPEADGAFYLFPRIEGLADSLEFCKQLLSVEQVGVAPGAAFGRGGESSIRICYAVGRDVLEPALDRIARFLRRTRDQAHGLAAVQQ
jgi:aspartate aminotransferase